MGQLEDMNIFIRIIETGGISRAADQLGLAKSAVSRRLVDLETRLGVRLLNRTTRKSSLTEIGQSYYNRAIKVVDDVAELNSITTDANTSLEGTIKSRSSIIVWPESSFPCNRCFCKSTP